ncbi:Extra-large guanine nucleotide-binding protein 2 [Ancistrocladus abbreviatus]
MAGILKKVMPISRSVSSRDFVDFSVEYSIALEYMGPPLDHSIPNVVPVDVDRIPTAKVAAPAALLNNLALPVVRPVARGNKRLSEDVMSRCNVFGDAMSPIAHAEQRCSNSEEDHASSGELDCDRGVRVLDGEDIRSVKPSNLVDGTGIVSSTDVDERLAKLRDGDESSGTLGFSDSRDYSHELSESSGMLETPIDCNGTEIFHICTNPTNQSTIEPGLTPPTFQTEISFSQGEVSNDESLHGGKRKSTVTFLDHKSDVVVEQESWNHENEVIRERPLAERMVKKRLCYRCLKGNRFTEKEACIVCDAKYCGDCMLRAMGSMPEGRKCVTCIGIPVDESKRRVLGKCSRMLKRLLSESEIEQIMHSEISCAVNQLSPELVCVNGKHLCQEELISLQSCQIPPRNLKPGNYWYDKVSGFWGKEGHKPCQIISANLNVGPSIKRDASNGDTNLLINNREITKAELLMLRWAGVKCSGVSSFWLAADGSYQEEGMNLVKGNIWGKKRAKLVCALLSLPTPESLNPGREQSNYAVVGMEPRYLEQRALYKLLLVGNDHSGTSTIFKQARAVYGVPFSIEECQNIKSMIQCNLYGYLAILLEAREQFEEESLVKMSEGQSADEPGPSGTNRDDLGKNIYSLGARLKAFSEWLVNIMVSGNLDIMFPAATREYAPYVEELWKDAAIQATYSRRNELELPRVASYFLDRAVEIAKVDYEPSDTDILFAEGITAATNQLACMDFSFPRTGHDASTDTVDQQDPSARYQLVRVHAKSFGKKCKWLEMFADVGIVLFCVALTDYDEYEVDEDRIITNKMLASKRLFQRIVTHPAFEEMNFLLVLNKFDLLEEKIEQVPLSKCEWFHDFNPVLSRQHGTRNSISGTPPLAQRAFHYIAVKFKRLFNELTGRKLYVSGVTALEPDTVDGALRYAREIIKWEEEKFTVSCNELSSDSIEPSSS